MLGVEFIHKDKDIIGFNIVSHVGYDVYGKDIVCAAVSATSQMVIMGLTEFLNEGYEFCDNNNDLFYLLLQKEQIHDIKSFEKAIVLIMAFNRFILQLGQQYQNHITISDYFVE